MLVIFSALLAVLAGIFLPSIVTRWGAHRRRGVVLGIGGACLILLGSSCYIVNPGQVGHLQRVYFGKSMQAGNIVARPGENGPQMDVLGPGFHFLPLLHALYSTEQLPVVAVPNGMMALITAKEGATLANGAVVAPAWPKDKIQDMLDPPTFLAQGGSKGPQFTVLTSGQYAVNRYFFDVSLHPALEVGAGYVAVVKSNINERDDCPNTAPGNTQTGAPEILVPRGCAGIWETALPPGLYYLNPVAYQPTLIASRIQALIYSGGEEQVEISIVRDEQGRIMEQIPYEYVGTLGEIVGDAVNVEVRGERALLDIRVVIKVESADAPRLVTSMGDMAAVKNEFLTPALRSSAQQAAIETGGGVSNLISHRTRFDQLITDHLRKRLQGLGIGIISVELLKAMPVNAVVEQERSTTAGPSARSEFSADGISQPPYLAESNSLHPATSSRVAETRLMPEYELPTRIIAAGITGAAGIRQVGFFHPGGPMRNNPSFRTRTRPGRVLDPERILVTSMSNFGAALAVPSQYSGSVLSINPNVIAPLLIPRDFALSGEQESILNGDVQLYTAQSPEFLNQINNDRAFTANEPSVSNPRYISINNAFGRPWFANSPWGAYGAGSSTVLDPTGEPLARPPSEFAGGVFAGTITNRLKGQYSQGDLMHGAVGTAFMGASPDGSGFAVFAVVKADGSIVQVHVRDGVDGLAPPGTISALESFNPALPGSENAGLAGIAFEWTPERILYVADAARNRIAALHLTDDGKHFILRKIRYIRRNEFATPVDVAAAIPEIANPHFSSHTTLAASSDLYVLNRANSTLLRMDRTGKILARARLRIPSLPRADMARAAGMAVSADGRRIWITLQGKLPQYPQYEGLVIEVSAFDANGPISGYPDYKVVERLDNPDAKLGQSLFTRPMTVAEGLGPLFNASSCGQCHSYPSIGGMGVDEDSFVIRIAHFNHVTGRLDTLKNHGGPVAHKHSIAELGHPAAEITGIPSEANITSVRMTPGLYGMAELDEISDATILLQAVDKGDGVHGHANIVRNSRGDLQVGRYGWKAHAANLEDMVGDALSNELGVTNPIAEKLARQDTTVNGNGEAESRLDDDGSIVHALKAYLTGLTFERTSPQ